MTHPISNWLLLSDGALNLSAVSRVVFTTDADGHDAARVYLTGVAEPHVVECRDDVDAIDWAIDDLTAERDETHRPPSVAVYEGDHGEPAF